MHPHQLHALIAAHSLTLAHTRLVDAAHSERRSQRRDALVTAAAANIQAWRPVIGRAAGGHGDPVGQAVLAGADAATRTLRPGPLSRLQTSVDGTLAWLAARLGRLAGVPLVAVPALVPDLDPGVAREVWLWLAELDERVRAELGLVAAEDLAPGVECPACRTRLVHVVRRAPGVYAVGGPRLLVCRAQACVCAGEGCPCGMSAQVSGLVHVWQRLDVA